MPKTNQPELTTDELLSEEQLPELMKPLAESEDNGFVVPTKDAAIELIEWMQKMREAALREEVNA